MTSIREIVPRKERVLLPREIEGMISAGQVIVIIDNKVLRLDSWVPYHPGGLKPVQHMIGKDATDEFTIFHSEETRQLIDRYQVGRINGRWRNMLPPIQGGNCRPYAEKSAEAQDATAVDYWPKAFPSKKSKCVENLGIQQRLGSFNYLPHEPSKPDNQKLAFLDDLSRNEIMNTLNNYPALDEATQVKITQRYRRLHDQIQAEGLYNCNYTAYAWEFGRCWFLFGAMLLFLRIRWFCASAVFLGCFWSQLVFCAHDAAHLSITHNFTIDSLIGMIIAGPMGGLSLGWWKRNHNVHHIVTNAPEHDPDNQHLPFLAVSHRFLEGIFSTYYERRICYGRAASMLVPFQAYSYYFILMFGRFNLYIQSWTFLAGGHGPKKGSAWWHRWFEIAGNVLFWLWFGYGVVYKSIPTGWSRFSFIMISHMVTMPLHVLFTLSHFAMSTADLGPNESFAQKMLRTTMDVDCPEWLDFAYGGLQFQIVHHLFPRVPRHNLRRTQKLVQQFCTETNIPYTLYGFVGSNKKVATTLAKCQQAIAEQIIFSHQLQ
ncbi:fatty acid desaturase [Aspergillus pseudodeflectus]|uniref:Delta 8-(E)-sphingolipid desaturase n=1 Tax=Aspergillus pseudodeflectus TaxID=176178 RepID=A0ABR4JWN6_9EURO